MNWRIIVPLASFMIMAIAVKLIGYWYSVGDSRPGLQQGTWKVPTDEWRKQSYRDLSDEGEKLTQKMTTEGGSCSCSDLHVPGKIHGGQLLGDLRNRRKAEVEKWRQETLLQNEPMVTCRMLSPLSYVGGFVVVEPLKTVRIVGLSVDEDAFSAVNDLSKQDADAILTVRSTKKLGIVFVYTPSLSGSCHVEGNGTAVLEISLRDTSVSSDDFNSMLNTLVFQSTYYDIHARDILEVNFLNFNINIHIQVRREPRPRIYNIFYNDDIIKKVTIVTKTFERYECVERLVRSVNEYYPGMQILVADDSEITQTIGGRGVSQFIMPFKEGWFAGRNLVLSQVKTKYFVWVDDDFIFSPNTKLENYLEKFEDPRVHLDMVGGFFDDANGTKYILSLYFKNIDIYPGDDDGDCMMRNRGFQRNIEEFPECMIVDLVTNFFMAKTESVKAVGFDPQFERVGHTEHFIDAFGRLRIASCKDVFIMHKSDKTNIKYSAFRRGSESSHVAKYYGHDEYILFKNNFKCYRLG